MNGYGTIERIYRPLGVGTIKPKSGGPLIVFTIAAVHGGLNGFNELIETHQIHYRIFEEEIAGIKFAADVWKT